MGFWSDFGKGVSSHLKAFEFIAKHSLWIYFLYPIVITVLLFVFGFWSTFQLGDWLAEYFIEWIGLGGAEDGWMYYVNWILSLLIGLILKILLLVIFSKYLKYVVLIICSPVMALLSERVDEILTGTKVPFHFGQFLHDMLRGIGVTLRNMLLETLIILACLLVFWIPLINWLTVPLLWIVGWYFLGFSMMDYTYERRKLAISQGAQLTRKHKGIAIGNGMVFSFLLMIPFVGISIGPVLSVVAGTLATTDLLDKSGPQGSAR